MKGEPTMTIVQAGKPLVRETSTKYRGHPLIIEVHAGYILYREKGKQSGFIIDHAAAYETAQKIAFREAKNGGK